MKIPFARQMCWYLVAVLFIISIAPRVDAGMVPSEIIARSTLERETDTGKIQKVLEMKMVRERLEQFGYSADEISTRLDRLSDHQIHQIASRIDDLNPGQSDAVVAILVVLVIIIIVIIVLQVTGHKVVVTK